MEDRANKTVMCSVLFLDIAAYSKKSVSGQIALKEGFNAFLASAIRTVPISDRIILDTGDGAAISFLGDVEDALKAALILREKLLTEGVNMDPPLLVRMGINLGPVRLVKDINDQANIVGDGINVAQRVMGFADPGQVLVSRSYYDAVSRLSHEYVGMFHYQGSRTDKHVREHEIYAIGYPGEVSASNRKLAGYGTPEVMVRAMQGAVGSVKSMRKAFEKASGPQRAVYVLSLTGGLLLIIVVTKFMLRPFDPPPQLTEMPMFFVVQDAFDKAAAESAAAAAESLIVAASASKAGTILENEPETEQAAQKKPNGIPAEQKKADKTDPSIRSPGYVAAANSAAKTSALAWDGTAAVNPTATIRTLEETTAVNPTATTRSLEETKEALHVATALISISVAPWGEIYLDGRMQGVSPPLAKMMVVPGRHEIEIRNTAFPAYIHRIQVKAGENVNIKHKFDN